MSDTESNITQLPNDNRLLGSCPNCGRNIWTSDVKVHQTPQEYARYQCIECKKLYTIVEIIPF